MEKIVRHYAKLALLMKVLSRDSWISFISLRVDADSHNAKQLRQFIFICQSRFNRFTTNQGESL